MTLLAVPNISEGKDAGLISELRQTAEVGTVRVLDLHSDPVHDRSVLTMTGEPTDLVEACVSLAAASRDCIDLTRRTGVHPRLGSLDVCPFVPHNEPIDGAVSAAKKAARSIAEAVGLPVYLYGEAAGRRATRELRDLRRGGLSALQQRALESLPPDEGPRFFDIRSGVVCVGARGPLIAFNVWLESGLSAVRTIAASIRSESVRALGLQISHKACQVSMNLIEPQVTGIEEAFDMVAERAAEAGIAITATEIVGLVEKRFLPAPDATVARLLKQPGHSLEASLKLST